MFDNVFDISTEKPENPFYRTVLEGQLARRLRLTKRDGTSFSIPYAWLPLIYYSPDLAELQIKSDNITVTVRGRGLAILEKALTEETVTDLAEAVNEFDDQSFDVYISSITLEGRLMLTSGDSPQL